MKNLLVKTATVILGSITAMAINATPITQSCGQLRANLFDPNVRKAPVAIILHNGQAIDNKSVKFTDSVGINGERIPVGNTFKLEPGYHEFSAIAIEPSSFKSKREYSHKETRNSSDKSSVKMNKTKDSKSVSVRNYKPLGQRIGRDFSKRLYRINFGINIETNKIYRLAAHKSDNSLFYNRIKITSVKSTKCSEASPLPVKKQPQLVNFEHNLPRPLQLRLNALSKDISDYYHSTNQSDHSINLHLPARKEMNAGIVLDLKSDIQQGLLIRAITPRTLADKIGLKANDKIITFNGSLIRDFQDISNAIIGLQKLLLETKDQSKITVEVIRDGIPITLSAIYDEIILPEVRATIG